uniref:TransThyretin-Related family domain n=1 Tax=Caenorhabditis japonica TaxID=281687 RepID=A0A8R1DX46_CAEJA
MYRSFLIFLLALLGICSALLGLGTQQSVQVTGRLTCNGIPAKDVKIKLYEKEKIKDVKLDETRTDVYGTFTVSGNKREITNIDPKVNIYHRCNYKGVCYKKIGITIPDNFITKGIIPKKTYDIGEINLANQFTGQTTDCIN